MPEKDYIQNIENAERRFFTEGLEVRSEGEDQYFEGYSARFNSTTDLGSFTEEIVPGAFDDVIGMDIRCLFNHSPDIILGRTSSGTTVVTIDAEGQKYRTKYNPNDPDHVRVMEKVKRGDVSQSSFAFRVKEDVWEKRDGKPHRSIKKFESQIDVSPVTYPGYADTSVALRSLHAVNEQPPATNTENRLKIEKEKLELLKLRK